jgi:hypothetical protein
MLKPTARRKREPRASLQDTAPFTTEVLREMMQAVLRGKWKMPSDEALAELARILENWRQYYLLDEAFLPLRKLQQDARSAAGKLVKALREMRQRSETFYTTALQDGAPASVLNILKNRLSEIDSALQFLERFEGLSVMNDPRITATTWQWLVDVLTVDFADAMKSTDPDFAAGAGHGGPLGRFIAAIAPSLTGEQLTPGSVSTRIKARRKRPARG